MSRIALGIEYDGYPYFGWQAQQGLNTIQSQLENALSNIANSPIQLFCAGRTDAGVHATGQVIHFETNVSRPEKAWSMGVNSQLPSSIAVRWVREVDESFHARFSALSRRYRYIIYNHKLRPGILSSKVTWMTKDLDAELMQCASQYLIGEQDFSALRSSQCESKSPMRNVMDVIVRRSKNFVIFEIEANAFLHHMVRNIVGVLLRVGTKEYPPEIIREIIESKDRRRAFETAPAAGLYLSKVRYPANYNIPEGENLLIDEAINN